MMKLSLKELGEEIEMILAESRLPVVLGDLHCRRKHNRGAEERNYLQGLLTVSTILSYCFGERTGEIDYVFGN